MADKLWISAALFLSIIILIPLIVFIIALIVAAVSK